MSFYPFLVTPYIQDLPKHQNPIWQFQVCAATHLSPNPFWKEHKFSYRLNLVCFNGLGILYLVSERYSFILFQSIRKNFPIAFPQRNTVLSLDTTIKGHPSLWALPRIVTSGVESAARHAQEGTETMSNWWSWILVLTVDIIFVLTDINAHFNFHICIYAQWVMVTPLEE